jgi:hypothetical protein
VDEVLPKCDLAGVGIGYVLLSNEQALAVRGLV